MGYRDRLLALHSELAGSYPDLIVGRADDTLCVTSPEPGATVVTVRPDASGCLTAHWAPAPGTTRRWALGMLAFDAAQTVATIVTSN